MMSRGVWFLKPLSQCSTGWIRFSGRNLVRKTAFGWQGQRYDDSFKAEMRYFPDWESAIRWVLEQR